MARSRYRDYFLHASFDGFELPDYFTWVRPHGFNWDDTMPSDSGILGPNYEITPKQLLDPLDVEYHLREVFRTSGGGERVRHRVVARITLVFGY